MGVVGTTKRRDHGMNDPLLVEVMQRMGLEKIAFHENRGDETKSLRKRWRELKETRDGPTTSVQRDVTDRSAMAAEIKAVARELGADAVGCAELRPVMVDAGVELPHQYVIAFILKEDYGVVEKGPYPIEVEALTTYTRCCELADKLARHIREMGWPAVAHHNGGTEIQAIPAMHTAGLGELGKHGSLIHPEFGASHRPGFVTTDLPLIEDGPTVFGVQDRCMTCNLCAANCPGEAIPEEFIVTEGVKRWVTEIAKCYPYSRLRDEYCHICVDVCPYIHVENGDQDNRRIYKSYMRKRKAAGYRTPAWHPEDEEKVIPSLPPDKS
jgi:epoxyqueuosine reductase